MQIIKTTAKTIFTGAVILLGADMVFFMAWVFSGQVPTDGFYFGAITASLIKLL